MKERGCVDDINFTSEVFHEIRVIVEDVRYDELRLEGFTVRKEVIAYIKEFFVEIRGVDVFGRDAMVSLSFD